MIVIRINQRYRTATERFRGQERERALLEATRGVWRVGPRREHADCAAAVYKGDYPRGLPHCWHRVGSQRYEPRRDVHDPNRWEFEGEVATDVRDRYVGRSISQHLTPHNANPIVYVNVEQA